MPNITISKSFTFEASHVLPRHPGKCARLHGHSWKLTVSVQGPVNQETGFVADYGALSKLVQKTVIGLLDHQHLGQGTGLTFNGEWRSPFGPDFYPSSENLVVAIAKLLTPLVPELTLGMTTRLSEVRLAETCTCEAIWRPE